VANTLKLKCIFNLGGCRAASCALGARAANGRRKLAVLPR
jgi:hypothetical protein